MSTQSLPYAASTEAAGAAAQDQDPQETQEWLESLQAVVTQLGPERARFLLESLLDEASGHQVPLPALRSTPYVNTIPAGERPSYPGEVEQEERIERLLRWNAAVMVSQANKKNDGIGGHISTYASIATAFEVALNHFLQGKDGARDHVYFQGHASPGLYSRAWLEGRMPEEQLHRFRQESGSEPGLSSYPHPWLMPDYWEYPTVSMGLTSMFAIYQARFDRYLAAREMVDTRETRVWAFMGDGEMDEPESCGALALAAREGLDNLIFVVNCNLQRLDGPVRGNYKVIQELEGVFRGAGWTTIKCIWGRAWDPLFAADSDGLLQERLERTVDGEWQRYSTEDGAYIREHLFDTPELQAMVEGYSDEELTELVSSGRGGHDRETIYAAMDAAVRNTAGPTVIFLKSVKGFGLGPGFAGKNATHGQKKLKGADLQYLRDRLQLPIADSELDDPPFYKPADDAPEMVYLRERRAELGGPLPERRFEPRSLETPALESLDRFLQASKRDASTTNVFAQLLAQLLKDETIGKRIVPIIPDEARTFGMEALFTTYGIYCPKGMTYDPPDAGTLMAYREAADGQILEEGITEAGSMSSFAAAATSYSAHNEPMIPFYIFYSMFGFQRTGDQIWAVSDMRGRGFLLGATAGRTTLNGEGLQHEDGHSLLLASTVPNVRAYDPAFGYEVTVVIQDGLRRMVGDGEDLIYYLTLYNENLPMPAMPAGVAQGIIDGLYRFKEGGRKKKAPRVQLLASGPIMQQALAAQELLAERYGVMADVWSATSYTQLRREALDVERWNRLNPTETPRVPKVTQLLDGQPGPVIAVSDFMAAVPDQISRWVPADYHSLGTDGFGRSDTREALRRHFEIDAPAIAVAALSTLSRRGEIKPNVVSKAIEDLGVDPDKRNPARA